MDTKEQKSNFKKVRDFLSLPILKECDSSIATAGKILTWIVIVGVTINILGILLPRLLN